MKRHLIISEDPINEAALLASRSLSEATGAVVYFSGVVRGQEAGKPISALEYECFGKMAEHQFQRIFDQLEQRWPIQSIRVVHRIGNVRVNEPSLWVELAAPHRAEAFAACEWFIDELKRLVPIWKKPLPQSG